METAEYSRLKIELRSELNRTADALYAAVKDGVEGQPLAHLRLRAAAIMEKLESSLALVSGGKKESMLKLDKIAAEIRGFLAELESRDAGVAFPHRERAHDETNVIPEPSTANNSTKPGKALDEESERDESIKIPAIPGHVPVATSQQLLRMSDYTILECYGPVEQERRSLAKVPKLAGINWSLGRPFESTPPEPLEVELDDYTHGVMMPMFDLTILLFEQRLLSALRSAGVDNLDLYDTRLLDPTTGKVWTSYKAVNIIGCVSCANLDESKWSAPSGSPRFDVNFDSLSIDVESASARGLGMFRLGECVSAIVVHDRVRKAITAAGIEHLDFVDPSDWTG